MNDEIFEYQTHQELQTALNRANEAYRTLRKNLMIVVFFLMFLCIGLHFFKVESIQQKNIEIRGYIEQVNKLKGKCETNKDLKVNLPSPPP